MGPCASWVLSGLPFPSGVTGTLPIRRPRNNQDPSTSHSRVLHTPTLLRSGFVYSTACIHGTLLILFSKINIFQIYLIRKWERAGVKRGARTLHFCGSLSQATSVHRKGPRVDGISRSHTSLDGEDLKVSALERSLNLKPAVLVFCYCNKTTEVQ